MFSAGFR